MTIITPTGITGINSITSSGSTLSFQNVSGGNINVSGVNISSGTNINISGVSTFTSGPVLIGSGTSTGTTSQPLQVSGGAYVSDNLGIGLTNPFSKLDIRYSSSTAYSTTASPQTVNAITLLNTNTTATTTFSGIALGNARNGNTAFVGIECVGTGNDTTALAFKTQSAGPVFAEAARIDSSGNFKLSTAGTKILNSSGNPILQQTGSILQVAYADSTTQVSASTQTYTIIHSVTLTSVAANSRYFMDGYCHCYSASSPARANLGFSVTIGGTTTRIYGVDGSSGDSWGTNVTSGGQLNRSGVYTSSAAAGTSLTFNLLGTSFDATTIWNYIGYNHKSTITVMEISA